MVKRNADISVAFHKVGYAPQTVQLTKEIQSTGAAGFAGNVLIGGLVGMGVDAYTGAATDHKPNPVAVTLEPLARARASTAQAAFAGSAAGGNVAGTLLTRIMLRFLIIAT